MRKKRRKKTPKQRAKIRAWKIFSKYIRKKYADKYGNVVCVTCGKKDKWENLQAGHFIDGRNNTVLFNEMLVHPQCGICNINLHGNKIPYVLFMKQKYGLSDEEILELTKLKRKVKQMTLQDFLDIESKYQKLFDRLLKRNEIKQMETL